MITLIVGTNRPGSNTRKVATQIEEIYAELKVPLHVLDLAKLPPEIFAPTSYAEKPKSFHPFADAVLKSTGLHVVTPEYNGSVPGVLKYFIDMLKFPESFEQKPVCFTGVAAGMWGALRLGGRTVAGHFRLSQRAPFSRARFPAANQQFARRFGQNQRRRIARTLESAGRRVCQIC